MIKIWVSLFILLQSNLLLGQSLSQQGWPSSLAELYYKLEQQPQKNYVVLSTLFPTQVIDYRSAEDMKSSVNRLNFYKNFHPGHQMIGWKCNIKNTPHISFVGMNGETQHQISRMFDMGWGLTSMLSTYTDGYIETPGQLESKFESVHETYDSKDPYKQFLLTTVIEISESECDNLVNEFYNFTSDLNQPGKKFSLIADPSKYEGAVCNSFAFQLLSKIDRFQSLSKLIQREITLPDYLFGNGDTLPENVEIPEKIKKIQKKSKLSKLQLIAHQWNPTFQNLNFNLIDAELIILFQKKLTQSFFEENSVNHKLNQEKKWFEKETHRGFWKTVKDPIDEHIQQQVYFKIDDKFDSKTSQISVFANDFLKNKKVEYFKTNNFPLIIIEENNP